MVFVNCKIKDTYYGEWSNYNADYSLRRTSFRRNHGCNIDIFKFIKNSVKHILNHQFVKVR